MTYSRGFWDKTDLYYRLAQVLWVSGRYFIFFLLFFAHNFYKSSLMLVGLLLVNSLEPSRKPLNALTKQLNSYVAIVLKNGVEYRGTMVRCDSHMNVLLEKATERVNDRLTANYGSILLRGNNILYICVDVPHEK
jgi:small nuclear ribonucleoprotein (snRNP)-like protein